MIQFNLLPDVKLEYVKAQRTKHTVISAAVISAASAFAVFLLLFLIVHVVQKVSLNNLNDDIKEYSAELSGTPDLPKILTIQNQLSALPNLHSAKPSASRAFTYIQQVTPTEVVINDLTIDYDNSTVSISGEAPSLDKVNTYVDTLKFTTYDADEATGERAFSDVVLTQFTKSPTGSTYTIGANFNPVIFDNTTEVELTIPSAVSTRSVIQQPLDIFKKPETKKSTED